MFILYRKYNNKEYLKQADYDMNYFNKLQNSINIFYIKLIMYLL